MAAELDVDSLIDADVSNVTGDHDRFAHYARAEEIIKSRQKDISILALCGKWFKAKMDPSKFTVCPTCKEIYLQMKD